MFNLFGNSTETSSDIYCEELRKILSEENGNYELIDVRTSEEYHMGHIPNAKLINLMDPAFKEKIQQLDNTKIYYVYCRSGSRSMSATRIMANTGLKNVYNVKFGLMGWQGPIVQ